MRLSAHFNDGLTRAPERVTMGLTALVLSINLSACESGDQNDVACYVDANLEDSDPGTPYSASEYGSNEAALAACEADAAALGTEPTAPADDDGSADDVEDGDPSTGAATQSITVDGVILEWITADGVRVCLAKTRVFWDVSPETAWSVGYGWGGTADWSTLIHAENQYRYDGDLYVCPISAFGQIDQNGLFVQNVTRLGATGGPDDYTNWGVVYEGDRYAVVTGDTSDDAPTYALAYSVHQDGNAWRVAEASQGSVEEALD